MKSLQCVCIYIIQTENMGQKFSKCCYQVLESLNPPSTDVDITINCSPKSLGNICALIIFKEERYHQILSQIPAPVHKVIWRAYLTETYYSNTQAYEKNEQYVYEFNFDELPMLLYTWPNEEFILKDVMPSFPPTLKSFIDVRGCTWRYPDPLDQNWFKLKKFNSEIIDQIICISTNGYNDKDFVKSFGYSKIKKIDISGYSIIKMEEIIEKIEIEKPALVNKTAKLEIVLDIVVHINALLYQQIEAGTSKLTSSSYVNSFDSIILKFDHIKVGTFIEIINVSQEDNDDNSDNNDDISSIDSNDSNIVYGSWDVVMAFMKDLLANGPRSLELYGDGSGYDASNILEQICEKSVPQIHIQAVKLGNCARSLKFVQYLNNLVHLDLSCNNLHGKIEALRHMDRGLVYLAMNNCKLTDVDLVHLLGSSHLSTLKQLDLGWNKFDNGEGIFNLVELCKKLVEILYLGLRCCGLKNFSFCVINSLFHSINVMPNITNLDLYGNDLSVCCVTNLAMILKDNLTLQYVLIDINHEVSENFVAKIDKVANVNRSQLLFVAFRERDYTCDVKDLYT